MKEKENMEEEELMDVDSSDSQQEEEDADLHQKIKYLNITACYKSNYYLFVNLKNKLT